MSPTVQDYWDAVDAELARLPMAADVQPLPMRSNEVSTAYAVRLTSIGPYRIFGYFSVPKAPPPHPALLLTPRYGSVNHVPDYFDRERYAVLQVMHRGQRLADQPFSAAYPGLLTLGIADPSTYIYRGIVADCLRGAEFLRARREVDSTHVGIDGDDLALLTAARRPGFRAILLNDLLLYRIQENAARTADYPAEEITDYLRQNPAERSTVERTLTYFDPIAHAGRINATTLLTTSGEWLAPLREALGGEVEEYQLTHRGAEDHDWLDAWMAGQLGAQPRSRFREYA
jgi:cephalosporin-C deacetylase